MACRSHGPRSCDVTGAKLPLTITAAWNRLTASSGLTQTVQWRDVIADGEVTLAFTSTPGIRLDSFSAQSERRGDVIVVSMRGNADMAAHERLKSYLDELDVSAKTSHVKEAVFELQDLYFMNSTCLSLLLRLINAVATAKPEERYKLRFRSNPNLRWQKKSLEALRAYADELVVIE